VAVSPGQEEQGSQGTCGHPSHPSSYLARRCAQQLLALLPSCPPRSRTFNQSSPTQTNCSPPLQATTSTWSPLGVMEKMKTTPSASQQPSWMRSIDNYVQASPLPWKLKSILPGLMDFMPRYSRGMLATHLITYLRGARVAADIIVRTSSTRDPIRCKGYDLVPLDGRSSAILRIRGMDTAECLVNE